MNVVVVGLGEFGHAAAVGLAARGVEVIAIDREMSLVEEVKDLVSLAVCLDATNKSALAAHEVSEADALIAAIGRDFEAQVLTVVHASKLGIPRIYARAGTPTHAEILQEVGAHEVLRPEQSAAQRLVQSLLIPNVAEYFELSEGFSLAELPVPPGAHGRTLADLELRNRFRLNVVGVKRPREGGEGAFDFDVVPDPSRELHEREVLVVAGSDLDIARLVDQLSA